MSQQQQPSFCSNFCILLNDENNGGKYIKKIYKENISWYQNIYSFVLVSLFFVCTTISSLMVVGKSRVGKFSVWLFLVKCENKLKSLIHTSQIF